MSQGSLILGAVTYTYDNADRRATMDVPEQAQVVYAFDNADRLTAVTQGTSVVSFGYDAVRALRANLPALLRAVGFRDLEGRLSCVAAFGSAAWDRLFGAGPRPRELHPFPEIRGKHHAVSTPGDILFHIRADRSEWTSTNERSHVTSPWKGRETLLGNLSQNSCA